MMSGVSELASTFESLDSSGLLDSSSELHSSLQSLLSRVRDQLRVLAKEKEASEKQISSLQTRLNAYERLSDSRMDSERKARSDFAALRHEMDESLARSTAIEARLIEQLKQSKAERDRVECEFRSKLSVQTESHSLEMQQLDRKFRAVCIENADIKDRLSKLQRKLQTQSEKVVDESKLNELKQVISARNREISNLTRDVTELKATVGRCNDEVYQSKQIIATLTTDKEVLTQRCSVALKTVEYLRSQFYSLSESSSPPSEIVSSSATVPRMVVSDSSVMSGDDSGSWFDERVLTEEARSVASQVRREHGSIKQRCRELEAMVNELASAKDALQVKLDKSEREHSARVLYAEMAMNESQKTLQSSQKECESLRCVLSDSQASLAESERMLEESQIKWKARERELMDANQVLTQRLSQMSNASKAEIERIFGLAIGELSSIVSDSGDPSTSSSSGKSSETATGMRSESEQKLVDSLLSELETEKESRINAEKELSDLRSKILSEGKHRYDLLFGTTEQQASSLQPTSEEAKTMEES